MDFMIYLPNLGDKRVRKTWKTYLHWLASLNKYIQSRVKFEKFVFFGHG